MIVKKGQIFNLMDTNGRRSDVLNALNVYLEILEELKEILPTETWGTYPSSLSQFLFYEKSLEKSKGVFDIHRNYDRFIAELGENYQFLITKDAQWIKNNFQRFAKILDRDIEKRARHYTSTLVKIGFTNTNRDITEAGYSYLRGSAIKDDLEELLPLDNVNISLLRQLLKLKIFSLSKNGKRKYYSPFTMALLLLLKYESIDMQTFEVVVQGLTPYSNDNIKEAISKHSIGINELEKFIRDIEVSLPQELVNKSNIEYEVFRKIFKGSKSNDSISKIYYAFFKALKDFRDKKTEETYNNLIGCFDDKNATYLYKAFGYGKAIFATGSKGNRYNIKKFTEENADHPLLVSKCYVSEFYYAYSRSKWIDGVREYSDTTNRLLSATGLFRFKHLPELSYKEILTSIFDVEQLQESVFGEMTDEEYFNYEESENSFFCKNISLVEILNYSEGKITTIIEDIQNYLGVYTAADVKKYLSDQKNTEFIAHILNKYPKQKIKELLPLFSDRKNDRKIKEEVNDSATVPTIYEFIVGIAWYYISNKEFDLYNSLNLTLSADFEPIIHAGGGDGDIIIHYEKTVIMLEVTLMNKQAQKRSEWEPVLRHSLNLKAANEFKETITFFIADELDYNTINIWRAVASVPLKSTNTHKEVGGVIIMPFTNKEILVFLNKDVYHKDIITATKNSFNKLPQINDVEWREKIISNCGI